MKEIDFRKINTENFINHNKSKRISVNEVKSNSIKNQEINNKNNLYRNKRTHQTYDEAFDELNEYISKVKIFTEGCIREKQRQKGFFGRLFSKIKKIEQEEIEEWIDEISETYQIDRWMDKIENLIDYIDDFFGEDLTDYVEEKLGYIFSDVLYL